MEKWFLKKKINFKLPKKENEEYNFNLLKAVPKKKYAYVFDFYKEYEKLLNKFNIIALFAKKDTGKSWIGYLLIKYIIQNKLGNVIYGRLQELEKKNAKIELFKVFEMLELNPYFDKSYGKDYICFPDTEFTVRLVNISSYQSIRGAIGEDIAFIWFDEINAYNFPANFDGSFINILSTLGRKNNFKVLLTGNNETAINNPVLNALQIKFNWSFNGLQLATRSIRGVNIIGIQLGYEAFKEQKELSLAESIAINNPAIYNTFYLGLSNTNDCSKIINLKEDYKILKPLFLFGVNAKIFLFSDAEVKDTENNIENKKAVFVNELPFNYDYIIKQYDKIKLYTIDPQSALLFKNAIMLSEEQAFNFFKPLNQALKQGNLFFGDFVSNEVFLEDVLPTYHWMNNKEEREILINENKKRK